jgi:hypothetical protein
VSRAVARVAPPCSTPTNPRPRGAVSNQGTNGSDAWFWLGAIGSVVLAVFALLVICSAWTIMRDGHAERKAEREAKAERASERERQPLMGNNNQGIVYA